MQAVKSEDANHIDLESIVKEKNTIKEMAENVAKEYWFKYIEEDNLLYFQYNKCVNKNSFWVPNEERDNYPDFYKIVDDLVDVINNTSFDKLYLNK